VSDVLPAVRVPTVVLASPGERGPGEFFARRIRGARLVELPNLVGIYHWVDPEAYEIAMRETRWLVEHVGRPAPPTRVLSTVLFSDLVGSTEQASALGDRAWRELLERHHAAIRRRLGEHRGEEVDTAGDGFFATFDGPGRAIDCACSIREDLRGLGLEVRAGIHTGECELADGKVAGLAVHVGARIGRGARLRDGEGSRRGLGDRVRGPRRPRAEGRAGRVEALCRRRLRPAMQRAVT